MRLEMPSFSILFPKDPRDTAHVWEYDWLRELFAGGPFLHRFAVDPARKTFVDDALLAVWRPDRDPERSYIEEYSRRGFRFGLLHLGDEWIKDERHAVYRTSGLRLVVRNYWRPSYPEGSSKIVHFPLGYKTGFIPSLGGQPQQRPARERRYRWSFAGQTQRPERQAMLEAVRAQLGAGYEHGISEWNASNSLSTQDYAALLLDTVFVPVPIGNVNVESFRFYEALEAGCIPIAVRATSRQPEDYFRNLFRTRDIPFPLVTNWSRDLAQLSLASWDDNRIESVRLASAQWYRERKREVRSRVHAALFKAFQRDAAAT